MKGQKSFIKHFMGNSMENRMIMRYNNYKLIGKEKLWGQFEENGIMNVLWKFLVTVC